MGRQAPSEGPGGRNCRSESLPWNHIVLMVTVPTSPTWTVTDRNTFVLRHVSDTDTCR